MKKHIEEESVIIDFSEKSISKIAFARTREQAERIEKELGMHIYYPSELANFEIEKTIFVLLDG